MARRVKQFKLSWVEKGQDSVQVGLARGMLKFKLMLCLHRCLHPAAYSRVFDALLMYYALLLKHTKLFWVVQGIKVELKFKLVACLHWCLEPAAHSFITACKRAFDAILMFCLQRLDGPIQKEVPLVKQVSPMSETS